MSYLFKKGGARGCSGIHLVITIIADLAALGQGVVPRAARAGTVHAPVQVDDARTASIVDHALDLESGRARAHANAHTSVARRAGVAAPHPHAVRRLRRAARRGTRTILETPTRHRVRCTRCTRHTRGSRLVRTLVKTNGTPLQVNTRVATVCSAAGP